MKKLTPLASELRNMAAGTAPAVELVGKRRHVAASATQQATPRRSQRLAESAVSSLYTSDMVTLLYQSLKLMPDPDEVLRKAGMTRAALRKLSYDDEIAQALETRRDAAINTPWRLEGGNDDVNQFITEQIEAFEHLIFPAVWNARPYGYSVTQIVYQDLGGRVGLRWVGEMPFEYYFPQRDGTVLYRAQGNGEPQPILPQKYLIPVVNPTYLNPYGDALMSRLYWMWFFRTHGWQYWIQWLEQFGAPFLVGKTKNVKSPPPSTSSSVDLLAAALDKTRRGSSVAVDLDSEVTMLESKGTGQQFKYFDDAVTRQIVKVILGQTLTSSEGEHGGNRALGQVHDEVRKDKRRADVRTIKLALKQLVGFLFELNTFAGEVPEFVMEDEKGIEGERAKRDATFVEKGVLVFKRPYLQDHYDLNPDDFIAPGEPGFQEARGTPPQAPIDPKTGLPKKPADTTPPADKAKKQALLAQLFAKQGVRFTPEQEVIEELVRQMADELPAELLSNADILAAISEANDPNDLANRLAVVLQDADVTTFARVLNFGLGAATVIGFVHASERSSLPAPARAEATPPNPENFEFHFHMPGEGMKKMKKIGDGEWSIEPMTAPKEEGTSG